LFAEEIDHRAKQKVFLNPKVLRLATNPKGFHLKTVEVANPAPSFPAEVHQTYAALFEPEAEVHARGAFLFVASPSS
jgi:hypothetical protein